MTSELPFSQRKEREEPEETEHFRLAELVTSFKAVWFTLSVTLETASEQDSEEGAINSFYKRTE